MIEYLYEMYMVHSVFRLIAVLVLYIMVMNILPHPGGGTGETHDRPSPVTPKEK